jgi:hypothetical protein
MPQTVKNTPKLDFWAAVNEGRKARGLPEMLFGNAHRLWEECMQPNRAEFAAAVEKVATAIRSDEDVSLVVVAL